jgi:cytochrome P450
MQDAAVAGVAAEKRTVVEMDGAIAAAITSASRPTGVPPLVTPALHIPGKVGLFHGLRMVLRSLRHGIADAALWRDRFGDIHRGSFLDRDLVLIWDADEIQKILRNEGNAWSSAMGWDVVMFEGLDKPGANIGNLLALDFDDHKKARALVQPAFTMKAVQGYLDIARRGFAETVPTWVSRGRVDFKPAVRSLLAHVAGQIFTGISDAAGTRKIDDALTDFWRGMMALSRNPRLSPTFRRSRRGFATLHQTFSALAPERKQHGGDDLFSHMVGAADERDFDSVVRVFLTILFGAFDTTSAAVTSMAYLLAKHPEWQTRVRDEAQRLSGPLDAANLKQLKQLDWVWKETIRLMPVSGFVPRRALRDVQVGPHTVAAGTLVMPMQGGIGRHPKWWKEPNRFDPERFSPDRAEDKQHPALAMAFGSGAHACIGTQLATLEMKLLFHHLLTTCTFSLAKDYEARHTFTPMGMVSGKVSLRLAPLSPSSNAS